MEFVVIPLPAKDYLVNLMRKIAFFISSLNKCPLVYDFKQNFK